MKNLRFNIRIFTLSFLLFTTILFSGCSRIRGMYRQQDADTAPDAAALLKPEFKLGIDILIEKQLYLVTGKRIGLITNPSGVNRNLEPTADILQNHPDIRLTALFSPEHGIRGDMEAGSTVSSTVDSKTGLPVYSLYGETRKPTPEMLSDIDLLLFDIQDVGVRPYTYISTMAYAMEAAKEAGITFCVLDRPNPLGGTTVDGPVLDQAFKSFIGLYPIPYVHGMTAGELAWLFNMEFGIGAELIVVPVEGWTRDMTWEDTGLDWVPTSPHIPESSTVPYYASTGLMGELGSLHEGVGYTLPFKLAGAPWIDPYKLASELNSRGLPGISFRPKYWRGFYGIFQGEQVGGVQLHITDSSLYLPFATGLHILEAVCSLYPDKEIFREDRLASFNRAAGTDEIAKKLMAGVPADLIIEAYQDELEKFKELRRLYLLYK
ncbi:exo-beta-N-acetylmuramidase NamZ domain-containing protein [candidate division KSB1 bacterium]